MTCVLLSVSSLYTLAEEEFDYRLFSAEWITLDVGIQTGFELVAQTAGAETSYVKATNYYYPKYDAIQDAEITKISPQPEGGIGSEVFLWEQPTPGKYKMNIEAEVLTQRSLGIIKQPTPFPLKYLDYSFDKYKKAGKIITIDHDIQRLANQLAQGRTDLYDVEFALAKWTKENIEYSLDTTTAEASLSSTWVLTNKRGVCDELTSLFISLNRALGIPARFVSGIAYTNLDVFPEHWGPHGWAEVYYPDVGWVPYDITYGQFGYLDPTHIKLIVSEFASNPSVRYESSSYNTQLNILPVDFDIKVKEKGKVAPPNLDIKITPIKKAIGIGSYNLLQVTIKNNEYYYISTELTLQETSNMINTDTKSKMVYIKPQGTATLYWIIKVDPTLDPNYIYTFPIAVQTELAQRAEKEFVVKKFDDVYDYNFFKKILKESDDNFEAAYELKTAPFEVSCTTNKDTLYPKEIASIRCHIDNYNDLPGPFEVCIDQECKKTQNEAQYNITLQNLGITTKQVKAKYKTNSAQDYISLKLVEPEKIEITNLSYPTHLDYDDKIKIEFIVNNTKNSVPQNLTVTITHEFFKQVWELDELENQQAYILKLNAKDLKPKNNKFTITVKYMTKDGNYKIEKREFQPEFNNVSFSELFSLWMNYVSHRLEKQTVVQIQNIEKPIE